MTTEDYSQSNERIVLNDDTNSGCLESLMKLFHIVAPIGPVASAFLLSTQLTVLAVQPNWIAP